MPPRWLSVSILVFWLSTTAWVFYQDVWPLLLPNQAPPFTIALEDEVLTQQTHIRWKVFHNDHPCLRAESWVEYDKADDTFALTSEIRPLSPQDRKDADAEASLFGGLAEIQHVNSVYRVSRRGDLRSVSLDLAAGFGAMHGRGVLTGDVHDGRFRSHLQASSADLPALNFDGDLDPVPAPGGSILSPMHPVNRIEGLRPGQSWRQPLVDPVRNVGFALLKKYLPAFVPESAEEEIIVTAHVLPETKSLIWDKRPVDCFVIAYSAPNEEVNAETWVQADTGLVLRQEAERGGDRWDFRRE